jgi:hypothetical protein
MIEFGQSPSSDCFPVTQPFFVQLSSFEGRSTRQFLSRFGSHQIRLEPADRRSPMLRLVPPVQHPVVMLRQLSIVQLVSGMFLPPRNRHRDQVWPLAPMLRERPGRWSHFAIQFREPTSGERAMVPLRLRFHLESLSYPRFHSLNAAPTTRSDRKRVRCCPMHGWFRPLPQPLRRHEFRRHRLAPDAARFGPLR